MLSKSLKSVLGLCLLSTQLLTFSSAFAKASGGGSMDGGGGDFLLYDNRIVLADPYALHDKTKKISDLILLSKELEAEIKLAISLGVSRTGLNPEVLNSVIFSKDIEYREVDKIPDRSDCKNRLTYQNLPENSILIQGACTSGKQTWILGSLFKKMNLKDQALTIIHEGLRRVEIISDETMTDITNGLDVALTHYNLQSQGTFIQLTSGEKDKLIKLNRASKILNFDNLIRVSDDIGDDTRYQYLGDFPNSQKQYISKTSEKDKIYFYNELERFYSEEFHLNNYGGLVLAKDTSFVVMAPGSILGIGSYIKRDKIFNKITIGENTVVINSALCLKVKGECTLGKNNRLINSEVDAAFKLSIGDNNKLSGVKLFPENLKIDNAVTTLNLKVPSYTKEITLRNNAVISDSELNGEVVEIRTGSQVKKSRIDSNQVIIEENARINETNISNGLKLRIGTNATIDNLYLYAFSSRKDTVLNLNYGKSTTPSISINESARIKNVSLKIEGFSDFVISKNATVENYQCAQVGTGKKFVYPVLTVNEVKSLESECEKK